MAIDSDNMGQLTARSGILRSATGRSALAPRVEFLESTGRLIYHRPIDSDGDPIYTTATWTTGRE